MHVKSKREKTEKQRRYSLPPNGESGAWEPLSHLLFINLLQCFEKEECLSILENRVRKALKVLGKAGE